MKKLLNLLAFTFVLAFSSMSSAFDTMQYHTTAGGYDCTVDVHLEAPNVYLNVYINPTVMQDDAGRATVYNFPVTAYETDKGYILIANGSTFEYEVVQAAKGPVLSKLDYEYCGDKFIPSGFSGPVEVISHQGLDGTKYFMVNRSYNSNHPTNHLNLLFHEPVVE